MDQMWANNCPQQTQTIGKTIRWENTMLSQFGNEWFTIFYPELEFLRCVLVCLSFFLGISMIFFVACEHE